MCDGKGLIMKLSKLQIGFLLLLTPLGLVLWQLKEKWWLPVILVPIILSVLYYSRNMVVQWKRNHAIFLALVVFIYSGYTLTIIRTNIQNPPEWDYTSFWLNGRLAVQGQNFYDPENYHREINVKNLLTSEEFHAEIVDVAFWYPPQSILLFLPLGWFSLQSGLIFWYGLQITVLMGVIFLLWRSFLYNEGKIGLLVTAALTLMFYGTSQTIQLAQTGLLLLLLLLLYWHHSESYKGGIFLALAILVKPLAAVFLLYPLLKRQGRIITSAIGTLALLSAIVIVFFGLNTFASYNPLSRMPAIVYTELINQSFLSTILRLTHFDFSARSPMMQPIFLIGTLILVGISAWSIYRMPPYARSWAIGLLIPLALLVYPATLTHYSVMLLPVFLLLWGQSTHKASKVGVLIGFITLVYATIGYNYGYVAIIGFALSWIFVEIVTVLNQIKRLQQRSYFNRMVFVTAVS